MSSDVEYVPASTRRLCQLTGNKDSPGFNDTGKWGIVGTDMGIPVEHKGRLYLFFGDVPAVAGGSHPHDADPIVYTTDADPEPDGFRVEPVLRGGPGTSFRPFSVKGRGHLGTNETPTGGFAYNGRFYVFVITGNRRPVSYLTSSPDPARDFDLHDQISGTDGKFWQIAPHVIENAKCPGLPAAAGDGLLLWGQSRSHVYLAWMPLQRKVHPPTGLRYYAGPGPAWSDDQQKAAPLFSTRGITQLSVGRIDGARRWVLLYTRASLRAPHEGVVCRSAATLWDWSGEVALFDPVRDGAFTEYMHQPGRDDLHLLPPRRPPSHPGWAYAPFLLDRYTRWDERRGIATLYYLMSTNSPYQVMLMRSGLRFKGVDSGGR